MLQSITGWLGDLPLGSLYATIAVLSAFENFFPPFPSDAVIAFGAFLADRAHGSAFTVFFLGWFGNVSGACITYALGRRFGSKAFLRRLEKYAGPDAEQRIKQLHKRYGFGGLFVSRFLPGVRAAKVLLSVASASGVWFALITFLAFRAGDNWDVVQHYLVRSGKVAGAIAIAIVLLSVGVWLYKRHEKKRE